MRALYRRRIAGTAAAALVLCSTGAARAEVLGEARNVPIARLTAEIVAADLNGDGRDDLVTSIPSLTLVGVLLSKSDGTFANMPALDALGSVAVADFGGDGRPDVAVVGPAGSGTKISVYPGRGDGTFGAPSVTSLPEERLLVQVADFDADGRPDLLLNNLSSAAVLLGRPGNALSAPVVTPGAVFAPIAADLDGDGLPDLVAGVPVDANGYETTRFLGRGDGSFGDPLPLPDFLAPAAAGDFDGDGAIDLVGLESPSETRDEPAVVRTAYGDGHGGFLPVVRVTTTALDSVRRPVADFDGDGRDDVIEFGLAGLTETWSSDVLLAFGAGGGLPAAVETYSVFGPRAVAIGDFDGDGLPDVAVGAAISLDDRAFTLSIRRNARLVARAATAVELPGKPFRVRVDGANFATDARVFVGDDAEPWPTVAVKSATRLVLKGGAELESRFPAGSAVPIRVETPDGRTSTVTLAR